ncbi:MAG: hypothetical protein DRG24_03440, partial [Epsilonproteobacteria bacterium]
MVLLLPIQLIAEAPKAFHQLGSSFDNDRTILQFLGKNPYFKSYKMQFSTYRQAIETSFKTGYKLDQTVMKKGDALSLSKAYLIMLRRLEKDQKKIEYIYVEALKHAIKNDDVGLFEHVLLYPLSPLKHPTLRSRAITYYKTIRIDHPIEKGELLLADEKLEIYSRDIAQQMRQAYEEHLNVLSSEEVQVLKKT